MTRFSKTNSPAIPNEGLRISSNTLTFLEDNHLKVSEENKAMLSRNYGVLDRLFGKKDIIKLVDGIKKEQLQTDVDLKLFALQLSVDVKKEMAELEVKNMMNARAAQKDIQLQHFVQTELNKFFHLANERENDLIDAMKEADKNIAKLDNIPKLRDRMEEALYTKVDDFMVFIEKSRKDLLQRLEVLIS